MKNFLYPFMFFLLAFHFSVGQANKPDSTLEQISLRKAIDFYHESIGSQSPLYNGREYVNYDEFITGHQFFESDLLEEGSIMYDGTLYRNINLLYDIVQEEVIVEHFNKYFKIILPKHRVDFFSLLNHTFIWINSDSLQNQVLSPGFYEKLYEGKVNLLAKRTKIIEEKIEGRSVARKFLPVNYFYIAKGNVYQPVKSKNSVLKVFEDHKKEVRKYIRSLGINYKANRETAIVKMTQHYDKLIQQ